VYHELLPERIKALVDFSDPYDAHLFCSSAFLVLPDPRTTHKNPLFLQDNQHTAVRHNIKLEDFVLSEERQRRFRYAIMALDIAPAYHLTQIQNDYPILEDHFGRRNEPTNIASNLQEQEASKYFVAQRPEMMLNLHRSTKRRMASVMSSRSIGRSTTYIQYVASISPISHREQSRPSMRQRFYATNARRHKRSSPQLDDLYPISFRDVISTDTTRSFRGLSHRECFPRDQEDSQDALVAGPSGAKLLIARAGREVHVLR
jgi:hypothetical protein